MLQAALWGGIASLSLFIGSLIGIYGRLPKKIIAFIMALGTGVLTGASCFDLLLDSLEKSNVWSIVSYFLIGALLFTVIEWFLSKKGGNERKRSKQNPHNHSGLAIFAGTVMDAIPESVVIGVSLLEGSEINWLFIVAVFISNFPEALSSSVGLKMDGYSNRKIHILWISVVFISTLSSVLGYVFLKDASPTFLAGIGAFAAGGLITMVCSTMLPEAFEEGGPIVGFLASIGLIISFVMTF